MTLLTGHYALFAGGAVRISLRLLRSMQPILSTDNRYSCTVQGREHVRGIIHHHHHHGQATLREPLAFLHQISVSGMCSMSRRIYLSE
jgi:hypothetical protein